MPARSWLRRLLMVAAVAMWVEAASPIVSATTVVAPTFAELVAEAETIVRGRVVSVRPEWVDSPQGRVIKTFVTFAVERAMKGTAPAEITLRFLGGELDGESMIVAGMPRFEVGGREIVFISGNGVRFCPLVAMMHGRYRVLADPLGAEYIARNDGLPLASEHDVQLPHAAGRAVARLRSGEPPLTLEAFEQKITTQAAEREAAR